MTQIEAPKVVKKKLFSPVWLLPLVALALGAWLGIKSIRESGVEIVIHFPSATGIDVAKTLVKYQGLTVGKVTDIAIDDNLEGVNVRVKMDYRAGPYLKDDTKFWLVTPKASITGVSGLDALFSGNYIAVQPGDGDSRTQFEAEREAPPLLPGNEGIVVELASDRLGSLDVGSSVLFRQLPVGRVVSYRLEGNRRVIISAFIQEQYAHLVKADSRFWNVSGIAIDASLAGVQIKSESISSLLAGGISFSSSDSDKQAKHGDSFMLYESEANALGGRVIRLNAKDADGIGAGTQVLYRGLVIGKVLDSHLSQDGVELEVKIDDDYVQLLGDSARFWREGAELSLSGIKHAARLVTGDVIAFMPGLGMARDSFPLEANAPDPMNMARHELLLRAERNENINEGAEVRYRNVAIGTVKSVSLARDLDSVEYRLEILPEFAPLLTQGSYFVPESALSIDASLSGVKMSLGDAKTLVSGALSLIQGKGQPLPPGTVLNLYASVDEADKQQALAGRKYLTLSSHDGADLSQGSPVYYKKMQVGEVVSLDWRASDDSFAIKLAIDKAFHSLLGANTVFWRNSAVHLDAGLTGIKVDVAPLKGMLGGSISLGILPEQSKVNGKHLYDTEALAMAKASALSLTLKADARISAGAAIRYQGHQVGEITEVRLDKDLTHLNAKGYLYGDYADHFNRDDAQFLLVDAQISLRGIEAPETLLTGPFISVLPGRSDTHADHFVVDSSISPYAALPKDALALTLERPNLGSIKRGSQIFYRGIAVGQVDGYALNLQGDKVQLFVHIDGRYRELINQSSVFYDLSGISVDIGLFSGAKVQTGSLETILAGGIGVSTLDRNAPAMVEGSLLPLLTKAEEAWLQ
ncbi:MCE family protein [Shewanella cyperi]|uniref:MCE family protein n=1 Tax=Shewanella cyperi TaxID=2814292 RepID=A0A975AIU5_9GAMM|nr:MlaD family protein [Shewanella cyperi]QSX28617.1 MCE family protein [Shewanella cyperi]